MRDKDKLLFSNRFTFEEIDVNDKDRLLEAYEDRIDSYWLKPAKVLSNSKCGFACGVLCVSIMECLARTQYAKFNKRRQQWEIDKKGFVDWIQKYFEDESVKKWAGRIYEDYRCGLVHEGRIKNLGQFSYYLSVVIELIDNIMLINPDNLYEELKKAFKNYLSTIRIDELKFLEFKRMFEIDFKEEIEKVKQMPN